MKSSYPNNHYIVYFDGYSSPHKHDKAGLVAVIYDGIILKRVCLLPLNKDTTNNMAEALALDVALRYASELKNEDIKAVIKGDSKLIVDGYNKRFKFKDLTLRSLQRWWDVWEQFEVRWVPREENLAGKYIEEHIRGIFRNAQ